MCGRPDVTVARSVRCAVAFHGWRVSLEYRTIDRTIYENCAASEHATSTHECRHECSTNNNALILSTALTTNRDASTVTFISSLTINNVTPVRHTSATALVRFQ